MFKLFHTPIKTPLKTRILVLAAVLSCAVAGAASAADVKPRLIRFGYGLNEESVQGRARHLAQELEKISGGKLKMKTFGSANLGSDEQMQGALAGGAQEMMVGSTAPLAGMVKNSACSTCRSCSTARRKPTRCWTARWARTCSRSWRPRGWWAWSIGRTAFAT